MKQTFWGFIWTLWNNYHDIKNICSYIHENASCSDLMVSSSRGLRKRYGIKVGSEADFIFGWIEKKINEKEC